MARKRRSTVRTTQTTFPFLRDDANIVEDVGRIFAGGLSAGPLSAGSPSADATVGRLGGMITRAIEAGLLFPASNLLPSS